MQRLIPITYYEKTEDAELRGHAYYKSETREASGRLIMYNGKNGIDLNWWSDTR